MTAAFIPCDNAAPAAVPGGSRVLLVGAGPGDPELITLRAVRALHAADVVVYDRLVNPVLLGHCRPQCERLYVGKQAGCHVATQDEINALLLARARAGHVVVRLKGGDPFIFGRGGEEMLFLREHGVEVEVVPGVTAALGCAASAGVPLTHRGLATGVRFITAHARDDEGWRDVGTVPWSAGETLAIYMGLGGVAVLREGLLRAGAPADLPVMAVAHGTTIGERRVMATLGDMATVIPQAGLSSPCLLVVGAVVALAGTVNAGIVNAGIVNAGIDAATENTGTAHAAASRELHE